MARRRGRKRRTKKRTAKKRASLRRTMLRNRRRRLRYEHREARRHGLSHREYVKRRNARERANQAMLVKMLNRDPDEAFAHMFKTGQLY